MKILVPLLALSAVVGNLFAQGSAVEAPRLIVRLQSAASKNVQSFNALNRQHGAREVRELNYGCYDCPAVYSVQLPAGADATRAADEYRRTALFRYVEVDALGRAGGVQGFTPNDPGYAGQQWSLRNDGTFAQARATAGADIKMEDAWSYTQGDSTVTVAIIDSGAKLDHPEFAGRIWRNRREIPGNQLDDDGNGYVDDVRGWNFANNTNDPTDDQGHGTNVMGIVGATGNNNLGYAGVDWKCKLMVCKALNNQNSGFYSWWISSIYYAVNNGARVINMSLGGSSASQAMQEAVDYALARNVVVVACMMNVNSNVPYYPAALDGPIAVGATNPDDSRAQPFFWDPASGSSFGPHISVVGPGNYIYGLNHISDTFYGTYWGGTSQAAPHVSGLVALMLARNPQLTGAQIRAILQNTADDRVGPSAEDTPGWDQYFGHGRVNAARALAAVSPVTANRAAAAVAQVLQAYPNPTRHGVTLRVTDERLLRRELTVVDALGRVVARQQLRAVAQQLPLQLAPGMYWLTVAGQVGGLALQVE